MISQTLSKNRNPAITSDRWHVVHARWSQGGTAPRFDRSIVSEHDTHETATAAARLLLASLAPDMVGREHATRDQVLVRRPNYKSLLHAKRVDRKQG